MARVQLAVSDGALRCALAERDWLPLTAGLRHLRLPDIFVPPTEQVTAWCAAAGVAVGGPDVLDGEDELVRRALRLKAAAAVEVELSVSVLGEGAMLLAWTTGVAASSLVRRVASAPDGPPRLIDGVELSAFPARRLAEEIVRLVPGGGATPAGVTAAGLAPATARDLGLALHRHDEVAADACARAAGLDQVPPVIRALARGLIGECTVSMRGARGLSRARWLLCEAGWVEIQLGRDGLLRHTPYDETRMRALIQRELAAQLSTAA